MSYNRTKLDETTEIFRLADIVLLFILKGRDCMSKVLIEVLIIILIAGSYLILYSAVRVSAIADQRIAEIQKREAEKNLRTTPGSDCALNTLAIDEPLEYARLYLDGNLQMWGRCRRFLDIIVMFKKR